MEGYQRAIDDLIHNAYLRRHCVSSTLKGKEATPIAAPSTLEVKEATPVTTPTVLVRRMGPAWNAAMAASGMKINRTTGMYMNREIQVNKKYAKTLLRDPPCARCRVLGRGFRVLDVAREENLATKMCNQCIGRGVGCST